MIVEFTAELWRWTARRDDTWVFVSLPPEESDDIREVVGARSRGFGAVRVRVTIGHTSWKTSIFPSADGGPYALPLKKSVRSSENLDVGDTASITVELLDF
ncbi:DUF1905 domain-containing protein [Actinoplanes sp. TBRC 11911]|uniref:DUF1905 domain-containing protein n=1 Tax=Actinoplanes sp. TBRC 11911 TaxID=2729386 RepID=UPI00145FC771|nr:DUF1905 domain-containing protein [Actinoplanes sp. TBRC 11911]NMO55125.1 DUF1905 domain-containing protein [Actinoplanes sp. TBRC 11911]